jgi:hypothetical protein
MIDRWNNRLDRDLQAACAFIMKIGAAAGPRRRESGAACLRKLAATQGLL